MRRAIDITGQRFGRLVAIERADVAIGKARWRCQCDCGNTTIVYGTMLRNGHTTSCGCKRGKNQHSTEKKVAPAPKPAWSGAESAVQALQEAWRL